MTRLAETASQKTGIVLGFQPGTGLAKERIVRKTILSLLLLVLTSPMIAFAELPGFQLTTITHSVVGETDKLNPSEDEERYISRLDCYSYREESRPDLCELGSATDSADTTDGTDTDDSSGTTDGTDTTGEVDTTDATENTDAVDGTDADDAIDSTDAVDGTDVIDSTDANEADDNSDATDETNADWTDGTDMADDTDTGDSTDTTDGSDATGSADETDATDEFDFTDASDAGDATDGTDATDASMAPGKADAASSYFRFSVGVNEYRTRNTGFGTTEMAENYNVFVGSCTVSTTGLPEVSDSCIEVVQNEDPIENGESWASFTFDVTTEKLLPECDTAGDARIYLIIEYGDSFESEVIELGRDFTSPSSVSDVAAESGEEALQVSWGAIDSAESYRACVAEQAFTVNDVLDGTIKCSNTEQTNTRVEGLENGVNYLVAVLAIDAAGNISTLCDGAIFAEGVPIAVNDFYEQYLADGGQDPGGFGCATYTQTTQTKSVGWCALLFLVWGMTCRYRTKTGAHS